MAFPLAAVLAAAPGVISAAADIIRVIKSNKSNQRPEQPESEKLAELNALVERQAEVIEDLARNNRNLALAVRNNRILSAGALAAAMIALGLSVFQ